MKTKPSIIVMICCIIILSCTLINIKKISNFISINLQDSPKLYLNNKNIYYIDESYDYVQIDDDFIPYSKQDILNIIYTAVNSGWRNFSFYCPKEYTNCLEDVRTLTKDPEKMTHLNNFVHPYNSFSNIKTFTDESGEVTVNINFLYTQEQIDVINTKVDQIMKKELNDNMTDYEKIKAIHDYIINHSRYDIERNDNLTSKYESYIAYGPLIQGYATCNGYTDAMAIFLTKMGYKNYKIATTPENKELSGHIWNAVFFNGKWLHIDVTWDDPVKDDENFLLHKYFLVTTEEMEEADNGLVEVDEHNFLKYIYSEYK